MKRSSTADAFFLRADRYPAFRELTDAEVRESPAPWTDAWQWSERHVQAVWADPEFRPALLRTHTGEAVRVEHPGQWNLEAGPDFIGAALRIGSGHRRVTGDIEVHVYPADWVRHGHQDDARYCDVVAHVTYYPGFLDTHHMRSGVLQIGLREALAACPDFSFDAVDTAAYPYAARPPDVPCRRALAAMTTDRIMKILNIAGEARLYRKTRRLRTIIETQGPEQALYEECMAALGYRRNRQPFRRLARVAPLSVLREEAHGEVMRGYAFLLGMAGLMPHRLPPEWDTPARRFFRGAWDAWWKQRERWRDHILVSDTWQLSGLRPVNHPVRRLMAAAVLFAVDDSPVLSGMPPVAGGEKAWVRDRLNTVMVPDPSGFWTHHAHHAARPVDRPVRLIGRGRAAAILTNVLVPWMTATGRLSSSQRALLNALPVEDESGQIRRAAHLFLPTPSMLTRTGSALARQGLLQIVNDFCLPDRSGCRTCRLPQLLRDATGA